MSDYERTTVTHSDDVAPATHSTSRVYRDTGPTGLTVMQRTAALIFGVIQALIILRIVLLLLIANRDNNVVQAILSVTDVLVEPFRGMFQLDRISSGVGAVLDIAAVVALIGWTLIEALVIAVLRLGSRGEATTA